MELVKRRRELITGKTCRSRGGEKGEDSRSSRTDRREIAAGAERRCTEARKIARREAPRLEHGCAA